MTSFQELVTDLVYSPGFRGPCGHAGCVMSITSSGMVRCYETISNTCDHSTNPEPLNEHPDAHTTQCQRVRCGTEFWPLPLYEIIQEKK